MSTYYWLCKQGCQWYTSDSYHEEVVDNGRNGTISSFDTLNTALELGDNDAFCMFALHKWDLGNDIYSVTFKLKPARTAVQPAQLYIWGHHAGGTDRYFLVVVTGNSALHLNAQARPDSWNQKGGPYPNVDSTVIKAVANQMT
jgi:hypothetical protein